MKYLLLLIPIFFAGSSEALRCQNNQWFKEIKDIQYYYQDDFDSTSQLLNLLIPQTVDKPSILVWIGGGAWSYVDRHMEMDLARKLARRGIAVASVGHRLSAATWRDPSLKTGVKHPEHARDLARAIKYLHQNAEKYGFSQDNFFVGGFSSGAHLAAIITMDHQFLQNQDLPADLINGVIPISGTYDIAHYYQILSDANGQEFADNHVGSVFGLTEQQIEAASPSNYLDGLNIPMLLICDRNMLRYHQLFEEMLREYGYQDLQVLNLHQFSHAELWKHLAHSDTSIYREVIMDFIQTHANQVP